MNLLFPVEGNQADVVYTPSPIAEDMVNYFKPSGRVLDPCRGNGAFFNLLPDAEWCEIREGVDFLEFGERVDWIIGNPPYSNFLPWIYHSTKLADDLVYLLPTHKIFLSYKLLVLLREWGEVRHLRIYGTGADLGFPFGFPMGAFHFQKGHRSGMTFSYYGVK